MTRFISLLALCSVWAATAAPPKSSTDSPIILPPVQVQGSKESISKVGGSAHTVDEEELEAFEYNNAEAILGKVPGVTIRTEDGYGLRPNIGIRGANSDRSKKVTLMEDGVLFGPAPYSAPAAYYFPLLTRITGLEVFKGPAAILYGPQTIGGAINFFTRAIPEGSAAGADLAYGSSVVGGTVDNYHKVHGWYGYSGPQWGVLAEGVHLMTDGFKTLDTGGNTGFDKQEFMVKLRGNSDPDSDYLHKVEHKLWFSR